MGLGLGGEHPGRATQTSVHDPAGMHVLHGPTQLHKVLPHRPLWDEPLLFLEVLGEGETDGKV